MIRGNRVLWGTGGKGEILLFGTAGRAVGLSRG
jgi:hypothetical protein